MNTTPIVRTEVMQQILTDTYKEVGAISVKDNISLSDAWLKAIKDDLILRWNTGDFQIIDLFDYLDIDRNFIDAETFKKAAFLIKESEIPSENKVDIGID